MELQLLENGTNSLELGIKFYQKYLKNDDKEFDANSSLKLSVICIHNAIEILGKKILSDVNDLLIYKNISDEQLLSNLIGTSDSIMQLHDQFIVNDIDIHTIDYKDCIFRLSNIFQISESSYEDLKEIGYIRNRITHFGIFRTLDYHKILGVLNRCIIFIKEFIFEKINMAEALLLNRIQDTLKIGIYQEESVWGENIKKKNQVIEEKILNTFIEAANTLSNDKVELRIIDFSSINSFDISIHIIRDNSIVAKLFTHNIPRINSTLLVGNGGDIFGVVDFIEDNFYLYKNAIRIPNYKEKAKKFWKGDKKNCYPISIEGEGINSAVKQILENMVNMSL